MMASRHFVGTLGDVCPGFSNAFTATFAVACAVRNAVPATDYSYFNCAVATQSAFALTRSQCAA